MLPVMVKQISNPVKGNGSFAAASRPLNHQYLILGVADNGVLFFLNGAHNVF